MSVIAHTMEYHGGQVCSELALRNYTDSDYETYKKIYNDCFREMRTALQITPVECCQSAEELGKRKRDIFIYERNGMLLGSVAVYGNEIDDLIVAEQFQGNGYGKELLKFALCVIQEKNTAPIRLHVADWNRKAIKLYRKLGFEIVKTQAVR